MNEWGLPDWREASSYGDTTAWCDHRWRWEFYRRRDDLRADFDRYADEEYERCCRLAIVRDGSDDDVFKPADKNFVVYRGAQFEKYGYAGLPNPRFGDHDLGKLMPHGDRPDNMEVLLPPASGKSLREVEVESNRFGYLFDLDKPLGPQLDVAAQHLAMMQIEIAGKKLPKKRRGISKFLDYLRVLDAREAENSWAEIATILIHTKGDAQAARDVHRQAQALCFKRWS